MMTGSKDFINVDPIDVKPGTDPKGTQPALSKNEENTLAMFAHLSILLNLVTGFLGLVPALIIYFAYKDRSRYVAYQSLQAIIFQLVYFFGAAVLAGIVAIVSVPLVLVCIGLFGLIIALLLALVPIGALIYGIVGAVETYHGRDFQYWLVGQWVRKTYED
ncbi:MAG TPA: DUF4870 domain-containing protein [Anaerolineaceae bacterium]|nr:DUF4870 domain-containing protein [Anaerolineaceae bacterium]